MSYAELRLRVNDVFTDFGDWLGQKIYDLIMDLGDVTNFGVYSLLAFFKRPFRRSELFIHMEFIGNKSVGIIVMTGLFTGMALAFQIFMGFKTVNMTSLTGAVVALGICRELGPVLTGLVVAARAGGAMAARLASMRVSEQIDALEVMGVEPKQYLVSPRIAAAVLTMPLLTGIFDVLAIYGSYLLSVKVLGLDAAIFWENTSLWLKPMHIYEGLFKSCIFGLFFAVICTHRGFRTKGGAEGVGAATNRGVVVSMVMIIVLDFFLMNFINLFYKITGLGGAA
jgi:phospholipid/cholesterol/gamma-HCH transport system permease protein